MPTFETIYAEHADRYDQLVSREDYQFNLLKALRHIQPLHGLMVADLGAGTGRVTRILAPWVRHVVACDRSAHMLGFARQRFHALGMQNVTVVQTENTALAIPGESVDMAVAGWSYGHATEWEPHGWQITIGKALDEMRRIVRHGGVTVVIETLGTGRDHPHAPNQQLADYYAWLEHSLGWKHTWIRTDYRFVNQAESDDLTGFFFGHPAPTEPTDDARVIVPECTGIWWMHKAE